jgi:hypothetical protein
MDTPFNKVDKTDIPTVRLEALLSYIKMGNVDQAFDHAYTWIKDGTLTFPDYKRFVLVAARELALKEKRQEMYRG